MNDDIGNIGSSGIIGGGAVGISVGIDIGSMNSKSNNGRIIWDEERNCLIIVIYCRCSITLI